MATTTLSHAVGLLALELDPQHHDPADRPPAALSVSAATALIGHLAKDLDRILNRVEHLGLIATAALYDQTEILRPGFPLIQALVELYRGSLRDKEFTPQLIALGTDSGHFPVHAINPQRRPGSGPLLLLPFCFVGQAEDITQIAQSMEDDLMQKGEISFATREAIQDAFDIRVLNLSCVTLNDLCALLRVQLESKHLLPLWELLQHAWFEQTGILPVQLESGNRFLIADHRVHTLFYTFDDWAQFGAGRALPDSELAEGYLRWSYYQRQYTLALEAYGLSMRWVLASPALEAALDTAMEIADGKTALNAFRDIPCLSGDYLVESIFRQDSESAEKQILITHQADAQLGTLAYTVQTLDAHEQLLRLEHYYPLRPQGLTVIIDQITQRCDEQNAERQIFHPGQLLYSEKSRCLRPATTADQSAVSEYTH